MYHLWFQCVVAATISRSSLSQRFRCPTSVSSSTSLSRALSLSSLSREPATSVHPSLSSRDVVREGSDWWLCASSSAKLRSCTSKQKAAAVRSFLWEFERVRTQGCARQNRTPSEPIGNLVEKRGPPRPCPSPSPRDWGDRAESRTSLSSFAPRESRKRHVMSVSDRGSK